MDIIKEREYPNEYPDEAVRVLNAMTFTKDGLKILGSSALRSQLYAGDYDGYEIVKGYSLNELVKKFQQIIKHIMSMTGTYIGDIKAGEIEEWRVIPLKKTQYSPEKATIKIDSLLKENLISLKESKEAKEAIAKSYLIAKQDIKFHIIRWSPKEVIMGHKKLRDGRTYTLSEAFTSPSIVKLDVIAKVKGIYTDFSVIYELYVDGENINKVVIQPLQSLKESLEYYKETKNPYKALKRKFAIAKLKNDIPSIKRLSAIINSDLGKIYRIYSDIKTLGDLLEEHDAPIQLSDFKARLKDEGLPQPLLNDLDKVKGTKQVPILRHIEDELLGRLSKGTRLKGGVVYTPYKGIQ